MNGINKSKSFQSVIQTRRPRGMTINRFKKWSNEPANSRISEILASDTIVGYSEPITPTFLEPITFESYNIQRHNTTENE